MGNWTWAGQPLSFVPGLRASPTSGPSFHTAAYLGNMPTPLQATRPWPPTPRATFHHAYLHTHTRPLTALTGSALQIAPWGFHTPSPQPCLLWTNACPGTAASISITCFHMLLSRHLISVSKPSETHLCHSYLAFKS